MASRWSASITWSAAVPRRSWADNNPGAFNSLMTGLEERLFGRLPDATWIYPGHGNDSTLGAERPHLAEWRARGW
jgi:glyoxylase-like metal-dependent hydrolase (beta-lactamase superfamily II)